MRQEVINFGSDDRLLGVLTKPDNYNLSNCPVVLILNSGLLHRVGPNRLGTNLAFKLAEVSIASFRFDFSGIGDSQNSDNEIDSDYIFQRDTKNAIDYLSNKYDVKEFILFGLCSGAEVAFKMAVSEQKVVALCLINGACVDMNKLGLNYQFIKQQTARRYYKKNVLNPYKWVDVLLNSSIKSLISISNIKSISKKLTLISQKKSIPGKRIKENGNTLNDIDLYQEWNELIRRGIDIYHIFSEGSSTLDIYKYAQLNISTDIDNVNNRISVEIIKDVDHNFTPIWSQQLLLKNITKWISNLNNLNISN